LFLEGGVLVVNQKIVEFQSSVAELFTKIVKSNTKAFDEGAKILADAIEADRIINVIGSGGHSTIGAEELFLRAGGLANINAILDGGVNLSQGGTRSLSIERTPGYSKFFFDYYNLRPEDPLIIVNAYGINPLSIDLALTAKERGITTIGITSTEFANFVPVNHPARHHSGKKLYECVDVFINCWLPLNDAAIEFDGVPQKVGPLSTLLNVFSLNSLIIATISECVARGLTELPIYTSANMPEGDRLNQQLIEKYRPRIKFL
jgi:uncharacterized phosphosugar-binding protein